MTDNGVRTCELLRVIDGDTFVGRVVTLSARAERHCVELHIRVFGWNAAELSTPEGPPLKALFEQQLLAATLITVQPVSRSFERLVCRVFVDGVLFQGILLNALRALRGEHP